MKNLYPEQHDTHERQNGGNRPAEGEKHGQPKAQRIIAEQRYDGVEDTSLANSPGRANEDVNAITK